LIPDLEISDPTPHVSFVENKGQSAIRPVGDRPVEPLFLSRFGVEFGSTARRPLIADCYFSKIVELLHFLAERK
jgi:hypothetical protein